MSDPEQYQEITLQVPADFQLPNLFQQVSAEQTGQILTLGAQAYRMIYQEGQKLQHETLFQSLKAQATAEYEPQLQKAQAAAEQANQALATMKRRIQQEEEYRAATESRVREEERRNREEILKEKDSRIQALEQQVKQQIQGVELQLKETSRTLTDSFQSFRESMVKTSSGSKNKGTMGETLFQDIVQRAFGTAIEYAGSEGHQGDLHMTWKGHKILLEVKNYERNVDQKEVTKFHRDMEEAKDMSIGIMASLQTGITGHHREGHIDIEELRDGRTCIYLSKFMSHDDPVLFLQGLKPFLEVLLVYRTNKAAAEDGDSEARVQVSVLEQQRSILLRLVQNHQKATAKFKCTLVNARKKSDQIWLDLTTEMRETEHQVKLLLETLLEVSNPATAENDTEQSDHLPGYIFKHTDLYQFSDKQRKFIQDVMTVFEAGEDYSLPKKDLKELLKSHGYSEDTVSKYAEQVFQEDVWGKGKKDVKFFRRRA
jgi:hypothetical protein